MLITIAETALLLRCCKRTVMRRIQDGDIKAHRVGRSWRVPITQFEDFFDPEVVMNIVATAAQRAGL